MKNKYFCNPLNVEYRYQFARMNQETDFHIFREAADPSLICFKGLYYLFPSMAAGFYTSEDLQAWDFHEFRGDIPIYDYAPDVRAIGDYIYFCASKREENCSFYRSRDPRTEAFEEIEGNFSFWDPDMFLDEDGRLYFYWGCSNVTPIYGVELDRETMKPKTKPLVMFDSHEEKYGFERNGDEHVPPKTEEEIEALVAQLLEQERAAMKKQGIVDVTDEELADKIRAMVGNRPYIEGAWMTKYQGKYYLQYAVPGTEYNIYNDSVYVSDHPLGPFVIARNNPYSYKPGGFITGAGHGSTLEDKEGRYWHTATMRISHNHGFERRIGMWKAGFDEDGELYCDQRYGDWPVRMDSPAFSEPEWMLLSYGKQVKASSGTYPRCVTDEDIRTWWRGEKPAGKETGKDDREWLEVDLGRVYDVRAVQINFADDQVKAALPEIEAFQTDFMERYLDKKRQYTRWLLEGSADGMHYEILADRLDARTDYSHDFLVWEEGRQIRYVRLTIGEIPYAAVPCVSGIRVFGKGNGEAPKPVEELMPQRLGDLDMEVSWKGAAVGYNILWGYAPDKLYHSYMVYGKTIQRIGALLQGAPVYVRVDAFNENGITQGNVEKLGAV